MSNSKLVPILRRMMPPCIWFAYWCHYYDVITDVIYIMPNLMPLLHKRREISPSNSSLLHRELWFNYPVPKFCLQPVLQIPSGSPASPYEALLLTSIWQWCAGHMHWGLDLDGLHPAVLDEWRDICRPGSPDQCPGWIWWIQLIPAWKKATRWHGRGLCTGPCLIASALLVELSPVLSVLLRLFSVVYYWLHHP